MGGYVDEFYNGDITWHNISSTEFWSVPLTSFQLGNETLNIRSKEIILDTGTSYTLMPMNEFEEMLYLFIDKGLDCYYFEALGSYGC